MIVSSYHTGRAMKIIATLWPLAQNEAIGAKVKMFVTIAISQPLSLRYEVDFGFSRWIWRQYLHLWEFSWSPGTLSHGLRKSCRCRECINDQSIDCNLSLYYVFFFLFMSGTVSLILRRRS